MSYPPYPHRVTNFARDAQLGGTSPDPGKLDAELAQLHAALHAVVHRLRAITTPDNRLVNLGPAQAQALVGTWSGSPTSSTVITTTIPWFPDVSASSVLIVDGNKVVSPTKVSAISNHSGNIRITLTTALETSQVTVYAFAPGAGLQTKLAGVDGAEMIGIRDEAGLYNAANVEQALYEIYQAFKVFKDAVEPLNKYFFRDGSVPATGHFDLGGKQIRNLAPATAPDHAVTKEQLDQIVNAGILDTSGFLLIDGSRAMNGNLQMSTKLIVNLGDADINTDHHAVNVKTLKSYVGQVVTLPTPASPPKIPVGCIIDVCGTLSTGNVEEDNKWLLCDGKLYNRYLYPELYDVLPGVLKDDNLFRVPDLRGRLTVGAGRLALTPGSDNYYNEGAGHPYTSRNRDPGTYDGAEYHRLTIDEMPRHGHNITNEFRILMPDGPETLHMVPYDSGASYVSFYSEQFYHQGNDRPHENMPPVFAVNKYIRAKP